MRSLTVPIPPNLKARRVRPKPPFVAQALFEKIMLLM